MRIGPIFSSLFPKPKDKGQRVDPAETKDNAGDHQGKKSPVQRPAEEGVGFNLDKSI